MTNRLELLIDTGSAAIFGGAAFWCTAMLTPSAAPLAPAAAGGVGVLGVLALMRKVGVMTRRPALSIALAPLPELPDQDELLLTCSEGEDELLLDVSDAVQDELLLDKLAAGPTVAEAQARIASAFDALAPLSEEADVAAPLDLDDPLPKTPYSDSDDRVVALFGGERGPERGLDPGALKARIDAHLAARDADAGTDAKPSMPDASDALSAALGRLPGPQRG